MSTKKKKLEWRTEKRKVDDLLPYEKNPRIISDQQMQAMERSFKKFNLVELPAINLDGKICAGHQRIKILQILGRGQEEIEVRVPNRQLSEAEFKDYLLTSNRSGGSWNWEALGANFDVGELLTAGFDDIDLTHIFDDNLAIENDDWDTEKELKKIKKVTVKPGDLFQLGPHRLICGNNQDINVVKKLVGDQKIDLVNIDPPYNIGLSYNTGIGGKQNYGGKTNDKKSEKDYRLFLKTILENSIAVSKENTHYFIWCDEGYIGLLQELYKEKGISEKRLCTWLKNSLNPTPQVAFNKIAEWCLYGIRGKPYLSDRLKNLSEVLNKEISSGSRLHDDILDLLQIWLAKRLAGNELEHPTSKPPNLYEKSLRRCSKPGDNVLDLCGGSGALLIACDALKRRAFVAEVEPIFTQLIISRYEQLSKNKARKLN